MNNKVLTNFRDHPSLRFDDPKSVFKIDDKVYLIREGEVSRIIPVKVVDTNIDEPYKDLVRFYFYEDDGTQWLEGIDFAPEDEEALRQLINPETDAEKRIDS
jgi:hypothetical protein